jgi:hypothetical protein
MLKITLYDGAEEQRFRLEGKLSGPWVGELRQCWTTASSTAKNRATIVDLREVDFVDPGGEELLSDMHSSGVRLLSATPIIRAVVEAIAVRCGTVEGKPARRPHAILRTDAS